MTRDPSGHARILTGIAAAVACVVSGLHAGQNVFRSRTDAVLVDVLPIERGRVVADLQARDVDIRDNGTPQVVTNVSRDLSSLGIVLLLDTSDSLTPADLAHLRQGAISLATMLRAGDQLSLVTFSHVVTVHGERDSNTLADVFDRLQPTGNTALRDAAVTSFRLADRLVGLRPVLIAFTDGTDTASFLTEKNLDESARMSWASFFAVTPRAAASKPLEDMSDLTGGEVITLAKGLSGLPQALLEILDRLRQRYLVTFTPTSSTRGWHALDVRVQRPNVKVIARRGYIRQ